MTKTSANYLCFLRHFEKLVKRHGGRVVVIADGKIVGTCGFKDQRRANRLVGRARQLDPEGIPFVGPLPTRKVLATPLFIKPFAPGIPASVGPRPQSHRRARNLP